MLRCKNHDGECQAFDLNSLCSESDHVLCFYCLIENYYQDCRKIWSVNETNEKSEKAKSIFMEKLENQIKTNIGSLQELDSEVRTLKQCIDQKIDKISLTLNEQIKQLISIVEQSQQKINELPPQKIFLKKNEFNKEYSIFTSIKNEIKNIFSNILDQSIIGKCFQLIDQINDQIIKLSDGCSNINNAVQTSSCLLKEPCKQHNKEFKMFNLGQQIPKDSRIVCDKCIEEGKSQCLVTFKTAYEKWSNYLDKKLEQYKQQQKENLQKIQVIKAPFEKFQRKINLILEAIDQELGQEQTLINKGIQEVNNIKGWKSLNYSQALDIAENLSNNIQSFQQSDDYQKDEKRDQMILDISSYMIEFEKQLTTKIKQIPELINLNFQEVQEIWSKEDESKEISCQQSQKINYQLIQQLPEEEWCRAIVFNTDLSLMFAGCGSEIKIFEFQNGQLIQNRELNDDKATTKGHKDAIKSLHYLKKSKLLISGSYDQSIIVWGVKQNNNLEFKQKLEHHKGVVNCVIVNEKEDILISSSSDGYIKFWQKTEEWVHKQDLCPFDCNETKHVEFISLNESQNKLVSSGEGNNIYIIEQNDKNEWFVKQFIKVKQIGQRVCFVGDNLITFQPYNGSEMEIYKLNNHSEYIKAASVEVDKGDDCYSYFPQIFNKKTQILLNKNGQNVYLMKRIKDIKFIVVQTIKFEDNRIIGTMSDNGQFLVTWDYGTKQFQIRELIN